MTGAERRALPRERSMTTVRSAAFAARGDVAAARARFTDDAVIDSQSGRCTDAPCVGKAAIRKDLERLVLDRSRRVTPLNTYVAGNVVVTRFEAGRGCIPGS